MNDSANIQRVLAYWFADTGAASPSAKDRKRWFGGGETLDQEIRDAFSPLLERPLDTWLSSPRGCLAYVIVYDQFPLNIYRGQARAYAWEELAEQASVAAVQRGFDQGLGYGERVFMYMPLMHAEKLALQELGVQKFSELADAVGPGLKDQALGTLKFAQEHCDTVAKFSRFPFRNDVLGRASTAEEQLFLSSGAPRYGQ